MRRRPNHGSDVALKLRKPIESIYSGELGIVLSGGGSRAAYQVGALRALLPYLKASNDPITTIIGSSIGAVNGLVLAACLKAGLDEAVSELESLWAERTFKNSFAGSPSTAFVKAIRVAFQQFMSPGPKGTKGSIFDPTPLMQRIDSVIHNHGGLRPQERHPALRSVAVMTTIEGSARKPLLFLSSHKRIEEDRMAGASFQVCYVEQMFAKHGFASAALPSVLPPVELDTEAGKVHLVDGGISQNLPVDPAVRLGAERIILIDISGRDWWLNRYGEAHDKRPDWEVPAGTDTFCFRPPEMFVARCMKPLGPILKEAVAGSTSKFITSVGPVWPLYSLLRRKLGEEVAYEVMSYIALDPDYIQGLMERGFHETTLRLKRRNEIEFQATEHAQATAG
jgi:predicted acylesterase/phospholipase RssA